MSIEWPKRNYWLLRHGYDRSGSAPSVETSLSYSNTNRYLGRVKKTAFILAVLALALVTGCGNDDPLSLKLVPARLAESASPMPQGWSEIDFGGSERAPSATYHIAPDPLITEWNIVAAKTSPPKDNESTVAVRLNAYAVRQLEQFCSDPANLKAPLVLFIDGKAVDVFPLLRPPGDRLLLYGFSPGQAKRLEQYLEAK